MPNQVHVYGHSDQATFHVEDHQPGSSIARFMAEQVQQILSLIQIPKSSHEKLLGKRIWLLDLGASCHMTSVLSLLQDVWDMEVIPMQWPNGSETMAIKRGTIHLTSKLILNNVPFIRWLNCNLISIAQLVDDNVCEVTFNKELCVIYDLTTRSPIGLGEPQRGVYYFKQLTTEKVQVNKVVSHDIWNCRLGHLYM